jgi:hypothetical protein
MCSIHLEAGMLRRRAEQCRHLANGMKKTAVRARLEAIASDYVRMAAKLQKLKRPAPSTRRSGSTRVFHRAIVERGHSASSA